MSTASHIQVKLGLFSANTTMEFSGSQAAQTAQLAENLGLESVWAAEHIVIPADYEAPYPYAASGKLPDGETVSWPDPFIWLTYAAAVTQNIKLATGVTVLPLRNPLVAAKQIATLDVLSGGRVLLGVGVGWLKDEFEAVGSPFNDRGRRHDGYLQAMQALWTQEKATVSNAFVEFRDAIGLPRPAARIPIVVSGHSPAAARRAARHGDGLFPGVGSTEDLRGLLDITAEECKTLGRDPSEIEVTVFPGQSDADAVSASIERYVTAGVSRILLPRLGDDQLAELVGVLTDRFEVLVA
ncbi:LLM class F420-dependent oxidoreductase [Mycobacteroides abscessus]|uniref:LLM class F420-dependent oxidoreductase n=1 Tax=Mycobacteroides abscessus TaxID=36809 RepID=UPI0009279265|nr:LLM class F420-dependent oxidoreductase [Mycobacteroides abscessus]SHQ39056.1 putative F420-dependent oxidoreductase, Rv2161c family [Mycobacteroides abscessus subsp. abscessus]